MGKFGFKDEAGNRLTVHGVENQYGVNVGVNGIEYVRVTAEDAPAVAQAILAMSKADATVVPGKLPEVTIEEVFKGYTVVVVRDEEGLTTQWDLQKESIAHARQCGLAALAIANRIEEYFDSEEHAGKVLTERRDTVVANHGMGLGAYRYSELNSNGRHIVDTIIDLQDKLAAKEQSA